MKYYTRKPTRLSGYDYNTPGYYFITVCVQNKAPLLGAVVGTVREDGPYEHVMHHFVGIDILGGP